MTIATSSALTSTPSLVVTPQPPATLTGSGLDQLISIIVNDAGLQARISASDISAGAAAAHEMNQLILDAIRATGVANNNNITAADVRDLNTWLRANHLDAFTKAHGDDEDGLETGFHLVQNDGAKTALYGHNAVNTIADGLYHLAFEICDNRFVNEDGNANARISSVAEWLSSLLVNDLASGKLANVALAPYVEGSSGTGLDQLVNTISSDAGLARKLSNAEIADGARAADAMNKLIIAAIKATGVANDGQIGESDVIDLNTWLRTNHLETWTKWHGDDGERLETGFHLVQNDGVVSQLFGKNAINTVADGLYHLAFERNERRLVNEDGNDNVSLGQISEWLNGLLVKDLQNGSLSNTAVDLQVEGSTKTGLDQLVNLISSDTGLNRKVASSEIAAGALAADGMNQLIVSAIKATGVANNGDISVADLYDVNAWLRTNALTTWTTLHGDDENGAETGFHLVQNDGATSTLYDSNAVNTVADGIYHLGFEINDGRLLNEDGDKNASLSKVSSWLNGLLATDLTKGSLKNANVDPYIKGSTHTGLDQLDNLITADAGLNSRIATSQITAGAQAADAMNHLLVKAIRATGAADGGVIDVAEVIELNGYLRTKHLDDWTKWHGDDEDGLETGFHLVQNDGAKSELFTRNAVNTIADGVYHLAFEIQKGRLVNEDGDKNASLENVSYWLNGLLVDDLANGSLLSAVDVVGSSAGASGSLM